MADPLSTRIAAGFKTAGELIKSYLNIIIIVIFLLAGWQGWKAYDRYAKSQLSQREAADQAHKAELKVLANQVAALTAEKAKLATDNERLEGDVKVWRDRAGQHKPPAPVSNPPEVQEAVSQIAEGGVRFTLTVPRPGDNPLDGFATTPTRGIPMVWTWYKESLRVPQLETAYTSQVGLSTALTSQVGGLKLELKKSDELIGKHVEAAAKHVEREANLEVIVKDTKKEVKREKFNGWVRTGAALVVGYFGRKALAK
jgi:hypothetical protein